MTALKDRWTGQSRTDQRQETRGRDRDRDRPRSGDCQDLSGLYVVLPRYPVLTHEAEKDPVFFFMYD